jgi:hypothetical protein
MVKVTLCLFVCSIGLAAQTTPPCGKDLASSPNTSTFCVAFALDHAGKLVILPAESQAFLKGAFKDYRLKPVDSCSD